MTKSEYLTDPNRQPRPQLFPTAAEFHYPWIDGSVMAGRLENASVAFFQSDVPGKIRLGVVSKPQIRLKGKAQADEKAEHIQRYVSISNKPATQPLGLRWGFETTSIKLESWRVDNGED
jgi:hypothetical protein